MRRPRRRPEVTRVAVPVGRAALQKPSTRRRPSSRPPRGSHQQHRCTQVQGTGQGTGGAVCAAGHAEGPLRCARSMGGLWRAPTFQGVVKSGLPLLSPRIWADFFMFLGRSDAPLPLAPDRGSSSCASGDAPQGSLACFPINPYASLRLARTHLFPLVASQRTHRRQDAPWSGFTLRSQGQAARHQVSRRDRGDGAHALTH